MNSFTRFISKRWRFLVVFGCVYLAVLFYASNRARALAKNNDQVSPTIREESGASKNAQRLKMLRLENDRLRLDVAAIAQLKQTVAGLSNEITLSQGKSGEKWAVYSNSFQRAIEHKREQLTEIQQWAKDWEWARLRERAEARLKEKAAAAGYDPAKDREKAQKILQRIAETTQKRLEILEGWRTAEDKSEAARAVHITRIQEANMAWANAEQQLGADAALYEHFPVKPADYADKKATLMRSLIPDGDGLAATVYLDGTVEWTR